VFVLLLAPDGGDSCQGVKAPVNHGAGGPSFWSTRPMGELKSAANRTRAGLCGRAAPDCAAARKDTRRIPQDIVRLAR